MKLLLAAVAFATSATCMAYEPVYTRIEGQLLKAGKPFRSVLVVSCADILSYLDGPCDHPIAVKTDINGRFAFVQATGYPPCTVCSCAATSSVVSQLSCDPTMGYWFRVLAGEHSRDFEIRGFGFGIDETIRLTCDVRRAKEADASSLELQRQKFHLPLLEC